MLIGYNNDVQYRGKTFHIQTEDRGAGNESIESQLFTGGQILDTKITAYTEHLVGLEGEARDKKLKALMQASHRSLFKKLMAGEYNSMVGLDPVEGDETSEIEVEDFTPSQERVPTAAQRVEEEGEAAFHDPSGGQHVDLSQLKNKLSGIGSDEDGEFNEPSEDLATQVTTPPESPGSYSIGSLKKAAAKAKAGAAPETKSEPPRPAAIPVPAARREAAAPEEDVLPEIRPTGVRAWQGFEPPEDDLSIVGMVEAFLQS
ncbi:MAG: hypothetical protein ACNA8W_03960 [Bradymonadaceae bacterium]